MKSEALTRPEYSGRCPQEIAGPVNTARSLKQERNALLGQGSTDKVARGELPEVAGNCDSHRDRWTFLHPSSS